MDSKYIYTILFQKEQIRLSPYKLKLLSIASTLSGSLPRRPVLTSLYLQDMSSSGAGKELTV